MPRPTQVRALEPYRLWIRFDDDIEGEVDLSDLAGRGVFRLWDDPERFGDVRLGPGRAIHWNDEVELCPDALYLRLTGRQPEDLFPRIRPAHA